MGEAQGLVLRDYGIPASRIWVRGFRRSHSENPGEAYGYPCPFRNNRRGPIPISLSRSRGLLNVVKHAKESRRMLKTRWSIPNLTVYRVSEEVQVASTARVGSKAP